MKKLLPLLLAALVGVCSCAASNDPAPADLLIATWESVSTRDVYTSPTGVMLSDNTIFAQPGIAIVEFTATEIIIHSGSTIFRRFTYTRNGNTIIRSWGGAAPPEYITELTTSRLVLITTEVRGTNTLNRTSTYRR